MSDDNRKWKDILESKYIVVPGNSNVWLNCQSWWWRDLVNICREGEGEGWFQKALVWKVRSGDSIRFWEHPWIDNNNLKGLYPRLFSLSLNQGMPVGETGFLDDYGWQWNLKWRRERFQWEAVLEEELLSILFREVLYKDSKDHITWRGDSKGIFFCKISIYSFGQSRYRTK